MAALHHDDAVGHRQRLLLVVRHVHERDPELTLKLAQLDAHAQLKEAVEVSKGLVEQEQLGLGHEHARQRNALLLTA